MKSPTSRRAVLFDVDGVLVPTEHLRAKAHAVAVRSFGGATPASFYFAAGGVGKSHEETRSAFLRASRLKVAPEEYTRAFKEALPGLFQGIAPTPGIPALLESLKEKGWLLGAVSASDSGEVESLLRQSGLIRFFDIRVGGDEVRKKKPAPDAYRLALRRLRLPPANAVAIEDSETGLRSATGAGLATIAYRHRYNQEHGFSGAAAVLGSFSDRKKFMAMIGRLTRTGL